MNKIPVRRSLAVFLGVAVTFCLLELALRVFGFIQLKQTARANFRKDNSYKILCLGDSFTFGVGAPSGQGYPEQLQEMLDAKAGKKTFTVINRGVNSSNTAMILRRFRDYLAKEPKPDLVLLLAGGANTWNAIGRGRDNPLKDFFLNLKVYKLTRLLAMNVSDKMVSGKPEKKDTPRNRKFTPAEQKINNSCCEDFVNLMKTNRYEEALKPAFKLLELDPGNPNSYARIARVYFLMEDRKKAADYYRKAIEVDPQGELVEFCYTRFARCFIRSQKKSETAYAVRYLSEGQKRCPEVKYFIRMLRNQTEYFNELYPWVSGDFKEIAGLCRQRGIKLVILNYPRGIMYNHDVNSIIKRVVNEQSFNFVDNESVFKQLLENEYKVEDLFVPDTHCNARGYGVMAKNVFDKFVQIGIVNPRQEQP